LNGLERFGTSLAYKRLKNKEAVESRTQKETKMKAINQSITKGLKVEATLPVLKSLANKISQLSEVLWLCITFLLFIAMGPFSVIAVIYGLWSLSTSENREKMTEPASC
jgi:hypothetical protein